MSRLQFFPSRTMALYVAKMFLIRALAILVMLVVVLQTLDLLGESAKILAVPGNSDADVWRYVGLRLPQLVARFLPFAVLLGTLLTLATLNQHSEVISMKAGGMSAHQILAPLIMASLLIAAASFVFNERIVARATASLGAWQRVEYARVPPDSGVRTNVWVRDGEALINAAIVRYERNPVRLEQVTVYQRQQGILRSIATADTGRYVGPGWRIEDVRLFDVASGTQRTLPSMAFGERLQPQRFTLANVKGDELSFLPLRGAIGELRDAGRSTGALEAAWWHKISGPLSSVLMPLLGAVAAFGLARSGQLFVRAVIGMALGFAFFVVDNFGLAMGNLGAYPPLLAAWGPFLLFLLIGEAVLVRTEE